MCACLRKRNDTSVQDKNHPYSAVKPENRSQFSGSVDGWWPSSRIGFPLRLLMCSGWRLTAESGFNDRIVSRCCSAALTSSLIFGLFLPISSLNCYCIFAVFHQSLAFFFQSSWNCCSITCRTCERRESSYSATISSATDKNVKLSLKKCGCFSHWS